MNANPPALPLAWMGHKSPFCVRVCAWCPDKAETEKIARASGFAITHSMCDKCFREQMAVVLNEKFNPDEN